MVYLHLKLIIVLVPLWIIWSKSATADEVCVCGEGHFYDFCEGDTAKCSPCKPGTYLDATAHKFISCTECDTSCLENANITKKCSRTQNLQCECRSGWYSLDGGLKSTCYPHSTCPAGYQVQEKGTGTRNTICEICPNGTFSSSDNFEACQHHTNCSLLGFKLLQYGNSTQDSECEPIECQCPPCEITDYEDCKDKDDEIKTWMTISITFIIMTGLCLIALVLLTVMFIAKWSKKKEPTDANMPLLQKGHPNPHVAIMDHASAHLSKDIQIKDLLFAQMKQKGIISHEVVERIDNKNSPPIQKVTELLDYLRQRPLSDYILFLDCLIIEKQGHLLKYLLPADENDEIPTSNHLLEHLQIRKLENYVKFMVPFAEKKHERELRMLFPIE